MQVLVLTQDAACAAALTGALSRAEQHVEAVGSWRSAQSRLADGGIDAVVVDLRARPEAASALGAVRAEAADLHLVAITDDDPEAVVRALDAGADDAVRAPGEAPEVAARLRAVERRWGRRDRAVLRAGGLVVDPVARVLMRDEQRVDLTRLEFDLLHHLVANQGRTFSRDELLHAVWRSASAWQSPDTVTEHVSRLRRKIEADPARPQHLVTVRGSGYRFEAAPQHPLKAWGPGSSLPPGPTRT